MQITILNGKNITSGKMANEILFQYSSWFSVGRLLGYKSFLSAPLSGSANSILTDEVKKQLEKHTNCRRFPHRWSYI